MRLFGKEIMNRIKLIKCKSTTTATMQERTAIQIIIITQKGPAAPHGTTFWSLLKWALWRYRSVNCPHCLQKCKLSHCLQKCELSLMFTEVWIVPTVYTSVNCPYCLLKCELSPLFTQVWIVPLFTEVWIVTTAYWSVYYPYCLLKCELSPLFTEVWIVPTPSDETQNE